MLVALEGIDGSGKGTQSAELARRCREAGWQTALISFPRYEATLYGQAIGEFLNGRFGPIDQVDPLLSALLYAGDRLESKPLLIDTMAENDVVILDRYVASNVAHQAAKLDGDRRDHLIRQIETIEYKINALPRPDLVLLLDLSAQAAQQLILKKEKRGYTERKLDLHESDAGYLERVREVYLRLASERESWRRIDCEGPAGLRTVDEIAADVWHAVETFRKQ